MNEELLHQKIDDQIMESHPSIGDTSCKLELCNSLHDLQAAVQVQESPLLGGLYYLYNLEEGEAFRLVTFRDFLRLVSFNFPSYLMSLPLKCPWSYQVFLMDRLF
jgi:hypothetical protein